jgi:hypothetical protein
MDIHDNLINVYLIEIDDVNNMINIIRFFDHVHMTDPGCEDRGSSNGNGVFWIKSKIFLNGNQIMSSMLIICRCYFNIYLVKVLNCISYFSYNYLIFVQSWHSEQISLVVRCKRFKVFFDIEWASAEPSHI